MAITLTNLNDNPPVITAGQSYRIDGGSNNTVARVLATDPDDTNQPGFTTFGPWAITSGNPNSVFRYDAAGNLTVARPLLVDWRRTSYTLGSTRRRRDEHQRRSGGAGDHPESREPVLAESHRPRRAEGGRAGADSVRCPYRVLSIVD